MKCLECNKPLGQRNSSGRCRQHALGLVNPVLDRLMDEVVHRYRAGKTASAIAESLGVSVGTITQRLRARGVWLRPHRTAMWAVCGRCRRIKPRVEHENGCCKACRSDKQEALYRQKRRRRNQRRHEFLYQRGSTQRDLRREAIRLRRQGGNPYAIGRRIGVSEGTVRHWTDAYRPTRDEVIVRLYVEEEVTVHWLTKHVGARPESDVSEVLHAAGVIRPQGRRGVRPKHAERPTLGAMVNAVRARRRPVEALPKSGWMKGDRLTRKQYDIVEILKASPEPMTTGRIRRVVDVLEPPWISSGVTRARTSSINRTIQSLKDRGFLAYVESSETNAGRTLRGYYVCDAEEIKRAQTPDEARRQIELAKLIEEQEVDDRDRVKGTGAVSLDAEFGEGGSFHDLLEDAA